MDKKFIIFISLFTLAVLGAGIFIASSSSNSSRAALLKTKEAKFVANHKEKKVGNIDYNKGIYNHIFPIENKGTKDLQITNMATSCACTKAYLKQGDKVGPMFTMKGMGSSDTSWIGVLKPGEKAEIVAAFDAQYHGPSAVGPISRVVSFETNDLDNPYVEVSFDGVVVK